MATVEIDVSEFKAFFQRMERAANGDFKRDFQTFLEGLGVEFLGKLQDQFMSRSKNTGYGQLVSSFTQGGAGNVWRSADDGLTLEVGSSVQYIGYVNDGHYTLDPSKHEKQIRFVPGYWQGNRFIYDPSAKGGMALKYDWVEGFHFWEYALHAIEQTAPAMLEAKLRQWLEAYFG